MSFFDEASEFFGLVSDGQALAMGFAVGGVAAYLLYYVCLLSHCKLADLLLFILQLDLSLSFTCYLLIFSCFGSFC